MEALDPKDLQPQTMLGMKLIQQPFSKTPDAENLFDFDALKQTRDTVSHHLQFSHLLMVIQGRNGSGKNSFANSLIVSDHPALYFFNATAEPGDTLRSVLEKAADNNHADDIQILENRIHDIMYRGQQPVLILNDAEQLDENVLSELIQYAQSHKDAQQQTQLKLLLVGDHGLDKKLEKNGIINHNQFYLIDLPQLNVSNTRSFLMHRLNLAGYRDAPPFSDKDITNIYNMANGNPAATLEYAAESLNNNKSLYEEDFGSAGKTKKILIIAGVTLFVAAFIYNSLLTSPEDDNESIGLPAETTIEKNAVDQLFKPSSNTMAVRQENQLAIPDQKSQHSLAPEMPATITKPSAPQALTQPPASITEQTDIKPLQSQPALKENTKTETSKTETKRSSSGIPAPEDSKPAKAIPSTSTPAKPITTQKPVVKADDKITRSFTNAGVNPPEWLLKQPSGNWSLQILGAYKAETLLTYVHQHSLGNKVAYYRTRLGNQDWHVILYGQYSSKEKAKAVIPYLPAYIRQNKPWPKDIKSVQNAIKQYKKLQK